MVLPQRLPARGPESQYCGYGGAGHLAGRPGGAAVAAVAAGFGARQLCRGRGADLVRHPADSLDAGEPVYVPVPLFPKLDVLPGGAGAGIGNGTGSAAGQALGCCTVRGGAGAVCVVLPGPVRPADRRLAGRFAESIAEFWVLLRKTCEAKNCE